MRKDPVAAERTGLESGLRPYRPHRRGGEPVAAAPYRAGRGLGAGTRAAN